MEQPQNINPEMSEQEKVMAGLNQMQFIVDKMKESAQGAPEFLQTEIMGELENIETSVNVLKDIAEENFSA